MNLNKVFIVGRLTADPELRTTPGGTSVVNIGVATNRVWTDKAGARQEETEYHNVVVWGRQAEVVQQFLRKGSMVLIEGRLQTRTWQDKQGQNRRTTEVVAERVQLGPRPQGGSAAPAPSPTPAPPLEEKKAKEEVPPTGADIPVIDIEESQPKDDDLPF